MNIYIGEPKTITVSDMQWPAPDGFHIPLRSEWEWLKTIMDWLGLTTWDGWRINLHMPFAGFRDYSSTGISLQGSNGYYWSSSPFGSSYPTGASNFYLNSSSVRADGYTFRAYGTSVRCFKNSFELPTSEWNVITWTLWSAWIFWNQTDWLISITSDWTTWYTIQDKNLWATAMYNDGDTLAQSNMWNMYQWWNNYGFPSTWSVSKTSSTQVDASNYWPSTANWYYKSDTFITWSYNWSSVQNDNLRWWVSQGTSTKTIPQEVQNIYIGEVLKPDKWPLRFIANTAWSTIKLRKYGSPTSVTLETSTDWNNWTPYTIGDVLTLNNVWDTIYWRNTSETDTGFSTQLSNYYQFEMTWSLKAEWIVNYLLNKNSTTTLSNWCFIYLFSWCPITTAPALPSITLANYCYQYMFYYCSSLVTAPSLPATTLWTQSYYAMFSNCENLETLPALPSTTIADYCYYQMFYKCYKIALSETKTWAYQTEYRIPTSWTWTYGTQAFYMMFDNTGGTYRTDPTINRTYYTSNTVV